MIQKLAARLKTISLTWLALGLCLSGGTLAWVGYEATQQWQKSSMSVAQRRADAAVDLLVAALTRDMRGAQATVLSSPRRDQFLVSLPSGVQAVASAFARYPYPEVFFTAESIESSGALTFYSRADRPPPWMTPPDGRRTPVVLHNNPHIAERLLRRIGPDVALGRPFSIFDLTLDTTHYQVVTLLLYSAAPPERFRAAFGFLVNMDWIRDRYFPAVAEQVARIANPEGGITYAIRDERNVPVIGPGRTETTPKATRAFPLAFFNPLYLAVEPPPDLSFQTWTAEALVSQDPTLTAANGWAYRSLGVTAVTALVLAIGLVFAVSVARTNSNVAEMRSEFVSAVTHELKTPIAALMTISETMASGRSSPDMMRDYAQMAVHETKRLHLLIENLLAYARITDIADVYSFESLDVEELLDDTIHTFDWRLERDGFVLDMSVAPGVPPIHADRSAVELALSNIIDNAIRYSKERRHVTIHARPEGANVLIEIRDRGIGISPEDLPHVRRRFVRGRKAAERGSGLGLAICDRIVTDHGGSMTIDSTPNVGTTVLLRFPSRAKE